MPRHLDETNSATLRRYRLMRMGALFRGINQGIGDRLYGEGYSYPRDQRGESLFYPLIAEYLLSEKEKGEWASVLCLAYGKGLRAIFDEHHKQIPSSLMSCAVNPYKAGRRDEFVSSVLSSRFDGENLTERVLPRITQYVRDIAVDLYETHGDGHRLGLSPVEIHRKLTIVLASSLELAQSLIHEVVCLAFAAGHKRGRLILQGLE